MNYFIYTISWCQAGVRRGVDAKKGGRAALENKEIRKKSV